MDDWRSAFAEEWDAVVLGTGMKECLLSGLLSVAGKKVLHLDRNSYYGGASASLDIHQLFSKFSTPDDKPTPEELGKLRDYRWAWRPWRPPRGWRAGPPPHPHSHPHPRTPIPPSPHPPP